MFSGTLERLCSFYNCNMAHVKKSVHAFGLLGDVKEEALSTNLFWGVSEKDTCENLSLKTKLRVDPLRRFCNVTGFSFRF